MQVYLPLVLAFVLSFIFTPIFRRLAFRVGVLDYPDKRKLHGKAMPLLGGAAVYFAFWLTAGITLLFTGGGAEFWGLFWGSTLIVLLGLYDDIKGLSYKLKFAGQFAAALVLVAYNIRIEFITIPFQDLVFLGALVVPLTVIWVVGITNAVNLIDGVDGLATGVSAIAALVMFALTLGEVPLVPLQVPLLVLVLAGAALGFLPHNFSPARIFLGDTGSLFLGFMLAGFSIIGVTKQATLTTLIIPVLILGLPITDTLYAMWRRYRSHRPIFKADNGHIHHRLLNVGLSTRQTVMVLYLSSIYFGLAAIAFDRFSGLHIYLIPVIFLLFLLGVRRLNSIRGFFSSPGPSPPYSDRFNTREK